MAYHGVIPVDMSGHRKPTSYRCNACSEATGATVWHETHRGLAPEPCPLETYGAARVVGHSQVRTPSAAPAHIPRAKLGTLPRVKHWHVVKFGGLASSKDGK